MYDLGKMKYFLSVEVVQNTKGIFISQKKYAKEVLKGFDMESCNPVKNLIVSRFKLVKDEGNTSIDATTYKQMVGSLMYLTATRLDLVYVVSFIIRFIEKPTELHQQAVKKILQCLKGIVELEILYKRRG